MGLILKWWLKRLKQATEIFASGFLIIVLGGSLLVLISEAITWGYNAEDMHLSAIVKSNVHPDPNPSTRATCGHFTGHATFDRGLGVRLGAITVDSDVCWDGTTIWPARRSSPVAGCTPDLPPFVAYGLQWCGLSLDSPSALTVGGNFTLSPLSASRICEHGWLRISIDKRGDLIDSTGVHHPNLDGNLVPGCT